MVLFCSITSSEIISKTTNSMCWSKYPFLWTPILSPLMQRDRYEQIRKIINFSDAMVENPDDSLRNFSLLLNSLADTYKRVYVPKQNVSVDEYFPYKREAKVPCLNTK